MDEEAYYCYECKKTVPKKDPEGAPECCGKEMTLLPLEECSKAPASAEHARFDDDDEPCDTGLG